MSNFRNQKTFCNRSYKKQKKKFYSKINMTEITDNEAFWKTTTRFLSSKAPRSLRITPIEKEVAKTSRDFFEGTVDKLDIMRYN